MRKNGLILFRNFLPGILLLMVFLAACKHDIPEPQSNNNGGGGNGGGGGGNTFIPCDSDSVYFNSQILPFLISNCTMYTGGAGCHDAIHHRDGVDLSSYQAVINSGIVDTLQPNSSSLIQALTTNDPGDRMPPPPAAPLSQAQINLIRTWMLQGAQNLTCENDCDTLNVTWSGTIKPLIDNKCKNCHQGSSPGGGVDLSTYANVAAAAMNNNSLLTVLLWPTTYPMPKGSPQPLPACEIAQIRIWVNAGAPNN